LKAIHDFFRLLRPANIITSIADVLAGIAIAGYLQTVAVQQMKCLPLFLLSASSACLYAGGIIFNDVFDYKTDQVERPERVLPKGDLSSGFAIWAGIFFLGAGILFAFLYSNLSGLIASLIAIAALVYDRYGKHLKIMGPLNMGICRGLNLLLGLSIISSALQYWALLGLVPVCYIYAITMISRGEVSGSNRSTLYIALFLYFAVISSMLYVLSTRGWHLLSLVFILSFAYMVSRPVFTAIFKPIGKNIGLAVKAGILGLIIMDAAWAATFGQLILSVIIVCLLPISIGLAKYFAVT